MSKIKNLDRFGDWALVAGAAEGLGAAFSEALAASGKNLILVDVKEEDLEKLAGELAANYNIQTETLVQDLRASGSATNVMEPVKEFGARLLVYNAAYGPVRPFLDNTPEQLDTHVDVNARTVLHLTHQFCKHWINQEPAGLLLLSSLAGLRGTLYVSPYAATKAFDWNLAESLYYELKESNLEVSSLLPGPVDTPNYRGTQPRASAMLPTAQPPADVARYGLENLGKKPVLIPGRGNRFSNFLLTRIFPKNMANRMANDTMRKTYVHHFE